MKHETLLEVTYQPRELDKKMLSEHLYQSNLVKGMPERKRCWVFLKSSPDNLIGGCLFYVFPEFIYVDEIWVAENARGRDFGKQILAAAEEEGLKQGCKESHLDTFSFQDAKGFYEKCGYWETSRHEAFAGKYTRVFMKKKLGAKAQREDIIIRETTAEDSAKVAALMAEHWGGEPLVVRGKNYFPSRLPGLLAQADGQTLGFLFYEVQNNDCEIVVFEIFDKFKGLGTRLLNQLKEIVKGIGCKRIYLMTNNDNLDALRFYQRRGFVICGIHLNTVSEARKVKPSIPEIGDHGIPLRDEIDLEYML